MSLPDTPTVFPRVEKIKQAPHQLATDTKHIQVEGDSAEDHERSQSESLHESCCVQSRLESKQTGSEQTDTPLSPCPLSISLSLTHSLSTPFFMTRAETEA